MIFMIAAVCISIGIMVWAIVDLSKTNWVEEAWIPATLLSVSECEKTATGLFQLNPPPNYGLPNGTVESKFDSCLCAPRKCSPFDPKPDCCAEKKNVKDEFAINFVRTNNATYVVATWPNVAVEYNDKNWAYYDWRVNTDGAWLRLFGGLGFCLVSIIGPLAYGTPCNEKKRHYDVF